MTLLALDTTGRWCSAALVRPGELVGYSRAQIGRGHAEHLAPQIQSLLKSARLTFDDVTKIAACTGPGSFTGLRVSLAIAKGLALPRDTPLIGINGLEVWAASADPERAKRVMAIADIRRGEFFWQIFDRGVAIGAPVNSDLTVVKNHIEPDMVICGDGAASFDAKPCGAPDPAILGWLAMDRSPEDYPLTPLYHRAPDAKLPGGIAPPNL